MVDIATKCKGAQNEDDSTLLSLDKNRLCRLGLAMYLAD